MKKALHGDIFLKLWLDRRGEDNQAGCYLQAAV